MLVVVVCREKKEVSNEIALFYVACGFIDGSASGCSNRATATISPGTDLNRLKTFYVVHPPKDTHNIHNLSRDKLEGWFYGNRRTGIAAIIESSRFYNYLRGSMDVGYYIISFGAHGNIAGSE